MNSLNTSIEIKWVTPTSIDVFTGKGWNNWTRFNVKRIKKQVFLEKIGGQSVDPEIFKHLINHLDAYPCDL